MFCLFSDDEYAFEKALRKHQIPIHEVEQDLVGMKDGHVSNAVYLGDESSDPRDAMNWMFFEPQRNTVDHSAEQPMLWNRNLLFKAGTVFHVYPEKHSAVLNRHSYTPSFFSLSDLEKQKSYIFAIDRERHLRNVKMAALDGFASAVPISPAIYIVRHQYGALRFIFIQQNSDEARESILESIRHWGDWPDRQIDFLVRLSGFLSKIEKRYGSNEFTSIREHIAQVFVYINDSEEWSYLQNKPWFNDLIEFLDFEQKFLHVNLPKEFYLGLDAEKVLGALETCAAKLKSGSN